MSSPSATGGDEAMARQLQASFDMGPAHVRSKRSHKGRANYDMFDMDDDPMSHGGMRQKDVNAKDIITDKKFFNAFVDDCDDDKLE